LLVESTDRDALRAQRQTQSHWVSGKDVILQIIGMIGVDGALYQSMEFTGEGLSALTMEDRLCMANMAIEAGAKNGIFEYDEKTAQYAKEHGCAEWSVYKADEDAEYTATYEIDLSSIEPTVSLPHLPENAKPSRCRRNHHRSGCHRSCTTQMKIPRAAKNLRSRQYTKASLYRDPATQRSCCRRWKNCHRQDVYRRSCAESTTHLGPCLGDTLHPSKAARGSTTNRNFDGCMATRDRK
jgi:3-isopropylmalate/(R)-2-methylmalate dehydratase large subunit